MANPMEPAQLAVAVNRALKLVANADMNLRQAALTGQFGGLDTKRANAWCEYGWPVEIGFNDLYRLYSRQGIANGTVDLLSGKCWETNPWIGEGTPDDDAEPSTAWETQVRDLLDDWRFWRSFADADTRRLVGGYAGILLQLRDSGGGWDKPVSGAAQVVRLIPAWKGQLTPAQFNTDANSPDYGQVSMWQYTEGAVDVGKNQNPRNLQVHPSRVLIVGDWRNGKSLLEPAYNAFVNMEKISGGSGESYLKNAARQLGLEFDKEADPRAMAQALGVQPAQLPEVFNETARQVNQGSDVVLAMFGGRATPLVSQVPDPKEHYGINLQEVAAATKIPAKVIVGMQTGERASTEDLRDFNRRGQSRRVRVLSFDIEDAIRQLIDLGLLPAAPGKFSVVWDNLLESTQLEQLEAADKMATINQKNAGTGMPPPFTSEEIRNVGGFQNTADTSPTPLGEGDEGTLNG